ncbi:DUF4180 domain-containing protein [Asticcacaulis sp. W401b]|uniref:DUF4180 domain-containing protein n=1 Tax=Asticcacaulis sp. W401b TaxID=3388666 RepID=UPI003970ECF3
MRDRTEIIAGRTVLFFNPQGSVLSKPADANDFIGEVWGQNAETAVIPVSRLGPDFLQLRTKLAGEVIQKFVNYQIRLVFLGDISKAVESSTALRDFVHESNRGRVVWFLPHEEEVRQKLIIGTHSSPS